MATTKEIKYDTSDQDKFAHNEDEIFIDGNGATLKKLLLQPTEDFIATGFFGVDADRFLDNGTVSLLGNAELLNKRYITHDNNSGISFDASNSPGMGILGTLSLKFTPPYTGNPIKNQYIFSAFENIGSVSNSFYLYQATSGSIVAIAYEAGSELILILGNFSFTAGQEYDIEIGYDYESIDIVLYIDGVPIGSGNFSKKPLALNNIVVGNSPYMTHAYDESKFRDIQIHNIVIHDGSSFSDEIPRIVHVYPLFSTIVPAEYSMAEGFLDLIESIQGNGYSHINYALKIENEYYYIDDLLALVVSDLSLEKSNSIQFLIDNKQVVTDFISEGARITFVPFLSSGPDGIDNIVLISNTLKYDFFVSPTACNQCTLYGSVIDNCKDIVSGTVKVFTKKPIITQGKVQAFEEIVDIDVPHGTFEIGLVIPNLPVVENRTDDVYYLIAEWKDSEGKDWKTDETKILIPNQPTVLFDENIIKKR